MKINGRVVAIAILIFAMTAAIPFGYFVYRSRTRNVITTGGIHISLTEKTEDKTTDFTDKIDVNPTDTAVKNIRVRNWGDQPAWVRVKVEREIELADGTTQKDDENLILVAMNGEETSSEWQYSDKDDYYYYLPPLEAHTDTEGWLRLDIGFSGEIGNLYTNSKMKVIVTAEATQQKNNPADNSMSAVGWPR